MKEKCEVLFSILESDDYFRDAGGIFGHKPATRRDPRTGELIPPDFEPYYGFAKEVNRKVYDYDERVKFECSQSGVKVEIQTTWGDLAVQEKYPEKMKIAVRELGSHLVSIGVQDTFDNVGYEDCMEDAREDCREEHEGKEYDDCVKEAEGSCTENNKEWWIEIGGYVEDKYSHAVPIRQIVQEVKDNLESIFRDMDKVVHFRRIE